MSVIHEIELEVEEQLAAERSRLVAERLNSRLRSLEERRNSRGSLEERLERAAQQYQEEAGAMDSEISELNALLHPEHVDQSQG